MLRTTIFNCFSLQDLETVVSDTFLKSLLNSLLWVEEEETRKNLIAFQSPEENLEVKIETEPGALGQLRKEGEKNPDHGLEIVNSCV